LLHDTQSSHSLLGQFGVKERLPYLDTSSAEMPAEVIHMGGGLCMISAQLGPPGAATSRYTAPLNNLAPDRVHPPQAFVDWWGDPVVDDDHGQPISRRQFVLWLANEEGGAHVDPSVDDTYAELSTAGVSRFVPPKGNDPRFRDLVAPTVRQIAHEVEWTLDDHLVEELDPLAGVSVRNPICSLSIHEKVTVGRNDPCPCGSGEKRKKCLDLRQPRRRISMAELMAELPLPQSS
jgi:SEC-C motif